MCEEIIPKICSQPIKNCEHNWLMNITWPREDEAKKERSTKGAILSCLFFKGTSNQAQNSDPVMAAGKGETTCVETPNALPGQMLCGRGYQRYSRKGWQERGDRKVKEKAKGGIKETSGNVVSNPVNQICCRKRHARIGLAATVFANTGRIAGIRTMDRRGVDPWPTKERMKWFS